MMTGSGVGAGPIKKADEAAVFGLPLTAVHKDMLNEVLFIFSF